MLSFSLREGQVPSTVQLPVLFRYLLNFHHRNCWTALLWAEMEYIVLFVLKGNAGIVYSFLPIWILSFLLALIFFLFAIGKLNLKKLELSFPSKTIVTHIASGELCSKYELLLRKLPSALVSFTFWLFFFSSGMYSWSLGPLARGVPDSWEVYSHH